MKAFKAGKAALLLFSVAVLLAAGAAAVRGQSALDGFDPNANGQINVVVLQPDGKILIGGDFTTLAPNGGAAVTRNRIARLNPDGTLDTAFNPSANSSVRTIALQADGKILVGGDFTTLAPNGGVMITRNRIARLNPDGTLDFAFNPDANNRVRAIALQADGKILAGGDFNGANSIGGQTRNCIARLDPTSGLADSFNPNTGFVLAIAVQADGKILVGGFISSIGGQTRNFIARLDPTTGLADSWNPNANNIVQSIAVQADGKILAGGSFGSIGGQPRPQIARLDATTGLADSFNPSADGTVSAIAVQADGKILAGGSFNIIGGQTRHNIVRLNPSTGVADSFNPNANSGVSAIVVQPDGKILAAGGFTTLSPNGGTAVTRNHIARLETDGRLDQTLNLSTVGDFVVATAVQADGKILIGGFFTSVLGVSRNNIARLNSDGTLDTAFNPNANDSVISIVVQADGMIVVGGAFSGANSIGGQTRDRIARLDPITGAADSWNPNASSFVYSIAVQPDGKILAGGNFAVIGGETRNYIARLDPTTGFADSFDPNANDRVYSITVQADGKILVGGAFFGANSIGGATRNHIARLNATTGLADSFDPNASGSVEAIVPQTNGKILVGGTFTSIAGQTRDYIARLDAASGLADSFDPNATGAIYSIGLQADGKILAGGNFTSIGGQTRNRIARLDPTTGAADSFNPNATGFVGTIAIQADGKILAGGEFSIIGGQPRMLFARLSNDTGAWQNLAATPTTVTWTRGGSSPQLARVTFEFSTDNLNYTSLGNGTAAGSNWTLTGLSLPTGQNFYIRARGYYYGGEDNRSGSILESVRNIFILPPPVTITVTSSADAGGICPGASCTLRQAIATAAPGDMINFAAGITTINLTSGELVINKNVIINGPGANLLSVQRSAAAGNFRIFNIVPASVSATISGLSLINGIASGSSFPDNVGGAILNSASLTLTDCTLSGNSATSSGGCIYNNGASSNITLTLLRCTLNGNSASSAGGGILNTGSNGHATVNLTNCTLDQNSAPYGGAIYNDGTSSGNAALTLTNCTLNKNSAGTLAGGIYNDALNPGSSGIAAVILRNTILRAGVSGVNLYNDSGGGGTITSQGNSLSSDAAGGPAGTGPGGFLNAAGDKRNTDPQLDPAGLANNGGPTMTIALQAASPAINGGDDNQSPLTDQRGYSRNGVSDIGSFEFGGTLPPTLIPVCVSRKLHGSFVGDIPLPRSGALGVECRTGGASGIHQVIMTFPGTVTVTDASVTTGVGSVSTFSVSGAQVTVNLTGISNAQKIVIRLFGVSDGIYTNDIDVPMGVLLGDTTGNGSVNATDVSLTKLKSGQAVDSSNFREDVTVSGSINASDVSSVKLKSGTALP